MAAPATFLVWMFWVWMFYECIHHERGCVRLAWLLTISHLSIIGAITYFFLGWVPRTFSLKQRLEKRRKLKCDLKQALANVRHIGKAHQYVKLGQVYEAMGKPGHALAAFQQALVREPDHPEALWGSATIEYQTHNLDQSKTSLERLMEIRPDFKFGDASLHYGQVLFDSGMYSLAQQHLEQHLKHWSHPEAALLMAQIQAQLQNTAGACELIEMMIGNVQRAPKFHYSKHRQHIAEGKRLLKAFQCSRRSV